MKKLLKISMLSLGVAASGGAFAQGACSVNYETVNSWGNGAQQKVSFTNNGGALSSWELCWSYTGNDAIANLWDGTFTQTGKNVCVKNAGYNGSVAAAGSASFGFIVNNPGAAPASYTLNGVACGGVAVSSSSAVSSLPEFVPSSSSSSSSVAPSVATRWSVNGANSTFNFVAVKKINTAESFTFTTLQGTVNSDGKATLTIPLASISSGIDIRNTRMQSILFESNYMPSLHFTTQLTLATLDSMAVGSTSVSSFTGNLVLHGISKEVTFDALVVKHDANNISVSPRKAIIINSLDFDLASGIEALRVVASLDAIGQRVPVYFKLFLTKDGAASVTPIQLPAAPATPLNLLASLSQATGVSSLNWSDVSNNETGFVVRRKDAAGLWSTVTSTAANAVGYQDSLTVAGAYDYKVIAFSGSVPSIASNVASVTLTTGTTTSSSVVSTSSVGSVNSSSVISGSSSSGGTIVGNATNGKVLWTQKCEGCHGVDGEKNANGSIAYQPLNPNRSEYKHSQDTQARSLRDFIAKWMPQGGEGTCTGQCAADLEAHILTWRKASDGIPDSPVKYFSCGPNVPSYGQRTLRLLTKNE
jgi:polyisoprenoid-binding protein YceI